jgi:hypothetical protein
MQTIYLLIFIFFDFLFRHLSTFVLLVTTSWRIGAAAGLPVAEPDVTLFDCGSSAVTMDPQFDTGLLFETPGDDLSFYTGVSSVGAHSREAAKHGADAEDTAWCGVEGLLSGNWQCVSTFCRSQEELFCLLHVVVHKH